MAQKSKYVWMKGRTLKLRYHINPNASGETSPLGTFRLYEYTGCNWSEKESLPFNRDNGPAFFDAIVKQFEDEGHIHTDQESCGVCGGHYKEASCPQG